MVDPAAESRREEEDAYGFSDATVGVNTCLMWLSLGGDTHFIDDARRFLGKAA